MKIPRRNGKPSVAPWILALPFVALLKFCVDAHAANMPYWEALLVLTIVGWIMVTVYAIFWAVHSVRTQLL